MLAGVRDRPRWGWETGQLWRARTIPLSRPFGVSRGVYESGPGSRGIDRDADIAVAVAFRRCAIASAPLRSLSVAADAKRRDVWRDALVFGLPRATLELYNAEYSCSLRMHEVAMQADVRRRAATRIYKCAVRRIDCGPVPLFIAAPQHFRTPLRFDSDKSSGLICYCDL